METLFKEIRRILTEEVPELRWVEADNGQSDYPAAESPVAFPAALIAFSQNAQFVTLASRRQLVKLNFTVKLLFNVVESSSAITPTDGYFTHMQLIDKVGNALHTKLQKCTRTGISQTKADDPIVWAVTFSTIYLAK